MNVASDNRKGESIDICTTKRDRANSTPVVTSKSVRNRMVWKAISNLNVTSPPLEM